MIKPSVDKDLTLGKIYNVGYGCLLTPCKLIQPTKKGFNFLNLKTNKCMLKQHLYAKGFMICSLPNRNTFRFVIWVPRLKVQEIYD